MMLPIMGNSGLILGVGLVLCHTHKIGEHFFTLSRNGGGVARCRWEKQMFGMHDGDDDGNLRKN